MAPSIRWSTLLLIVCLLSVSLPASPARADVAPPIPSEVGNISPFNSENTKVRMESERVVLEVPPPSPGCGPWGDEVVIVMADFTMLNSGNITESMQVLYPLTNIDINGSFYVIKDETFVAKIDGRQVTTTEVTTDNYYRQAGVPITWAAFEVSFPSNEIVNVQVSYDMVQNTNHPWIAFAYILETGAGWYKSIGSVDVIFRLPYKATDENILSVTYDGKGNTLKGTTPGYYVAGNELRWHWDNLEPTSNENIIAAIVDPCSWYKSLNTDSITPSPTFTQTHLPARTASRTPTPWPTWTPHLSITPSPTDSPTATLLPSLPPTLTDTPSISITALPTPIEGKSSSSGRSILLPVLGVMVVIGFAFAFAALTFTGGFLIGRRK